MRSGRTFIVLRKRSLAAARRARLGAVAAFVSAALMATPAHGAMPRRGFGPAIEPDGYQTQSTCDPSPKRGVERFRRIVLRAFPWTGPGSISRACDVGGTSEHKEGRAWDWGVRTSSDRDRRAVNRLFDWLFHSDRYGHEHARASRLGIQYLIWNRRI